MPDTPGEGKEPFVVDIRLLAGPTVDEGEHAFHHAAQVTDVYACQLRQLVLADAFLFHVGLRSLYDGLFFFYFHKSLNLSKSILDFAYSS